MIYLLLFILIVVIIIWSFMRQPQFGKPPTGERRARIESSPHFSKGQFQNLSNTPALAEGASYLGVAQRFFFTRNKRAMPTSVLPSKKTDLNSFRADEDVLVWFGHSSYFIQLRGKRILVDPVLSGNASPVSFTTKSFKGADVYQVEDIPDIDYLFITHDHYDHLDFRTIRNLKPKVKKIITGLGVGAHLEHWGFDKEVIEEKDWNEELVLDAQLKITTAPARHFSGRGFRRNGSLWLSFILSAPGFRMFIGGDSGYDHHFKTIGELHGPFDLVILENGQYNQDWKYIHMMPEEVVQAAIDLKAKWLFPVHWSKFKLALHNWDEPIIRVQEEATRKHQPVIHPMIGEAVNLKALTQSTQWWKTVS